MSDRKALITAFLGHSEWAAWKREPVAGDASARRYERLRKDNRSVILMDAPPEEIATTRQFGELAHYLINLGLSAPKILAYDEALGVMIISDLGSNDVAHWLSTRPDDSVPIYTAATDVLLRLRSCTPPHGLIKMTPQVGAGMVEIVGEYYAGRSTDDLVAEMERSLHQLAPEANTLALRDFHAENLIWRPALSGHDRVGLLDFQDAFIAPEGYDLASLLRDARRDVAPELIEKITDYYIEQSKSDDTFRAQLACLGAQRNLRIIGVFARLATKMNKPRYLDMIPRVWRHLQADLAHPALANLRLVVQRMLPEPTGSVLKGLRQ